VPGLYQLQGADSGSIMGLLSTQTSDPRLDHQQQLAYAHHLQQAQQQAQPQQQHQQAQQQAFMSAQLQHSQAQSGGAGAETWAQAQPPLQSAASGQARAFAPAEAPAPEQGPVAGWQHNQQVLLTLQEQAEQEGQQDDTWVGGLLQMLDGEPPGSSAD
jgi:hypothetical protein